MQTILSLGNALNHGTARGTSDQSLVISLLLLTRFNVFWSRDAGGLTESDTPEHNRKLPFALPTALGMEERTTTRAMLFWVGVGLCLDALVNCVCGPQL
ncbi:formin-like protein 6 [Pyrus ussuriensis x Pyrus communis]|uniref:Formin-like protein 6 n=1 Tax=Pyrus ussuriensis x Pyrus communis TaxID=2448454 RepID=A0A5N5H0E7_9ROSA|nr:formin-like protein 6 [Pyrus ussuriensis x Pyrus communis]